MVNVKGSIFKPFTENWKSVESIPFFTQKLVEYIVPISGWYFFSFGLDYFPKVYITRDSVVTYLLGDADNYSYVNQGGVTGVLFTLQVPMMKGDKLTIEKNAYDGWRGSILNIKFKEL